MKKGVKITAIIVGSILLLTLITPLMLRGKIEGIVKTEAAKMLNATLDFDKLNISLLRHFPNASINLKGLRIIGNEPFAGDTLIQAKEIAVVVNLMSIFKDSGVEVRKVLLDKPNILAMKNAEGKVNWDIMKEQSTDENTEVDSEPSSFKLSLKNLSIDNGRVAFIDDSSKMQFYAQDIDLKLKGDMSADQTTIDLELDSDGLYYVINNILMLNNAEVGFDAKIAADIKNGKYTFSRNKLKLNAIEIGIDGWVAMVADNAVDMDIKVNSSKVEFKELLSLIPAFYTKEFKNLSASGNIALDAWVKGKMQGDIVPAFGLGIKVNNGSFKYADLPKSVDNIQLDASIANNGGVIDNTVIDVKTFSLSMAGNTLKAYLHAITPVSNPDFNAEATGKINLGAIKEVYPLGDSISLNGIITANLKVAARMSDIEKELYENINASGTLSIEQMEAKIKGLPDMKIAKAAATINPRSMTLSQFAATIGKSDISAQGELSNYLAYALKNEMLKGKLNISSQLLDLNELMNATGSSEENASVATDSSTLTVIEVPKNLNLSLTTDINKIEFQKMVITALSGDVSVAGGILEMSKLNMDLFGGKVTTSGSYNTVNTTEPIFKAKLNIANASFSKTFQELDMIAKIVPIFEKTGGNYSMSLDMTTSLNNDMSPNLNSLQATGEIRSADINVQNIKAFEALASALKDDRIRKIEAKDVVIPFSIKDGKITTKPFDLKMGNVGINMSGVTGLDQSIDYKAIVSLPKGTAGGYLNKVNVLIGGTFTSPKITLDVKDAVKEAITNAINKEVIEKLTGSKDLTEEINKQADKLRAGAKEAGDKLVALAQEQGDRLINEAKNPIAKIAAKKGAELMVKKAQEQAQKLVVEAETQIAKLQQK